MHCICEFIRARAHLIHDLHLHSTISGDSFRNHWIWSRKQKKFMKNSMITSQSPRLCRFVWGAGVNAGYPAFCVSLFLSMLFLYHGYALQAGAEVALRSGNLPEALRQAKGCENEFSRLSDAQGLSAAFRLLGNIQLVDGQVLASVGSLQVKRPKTSGCAVVSAHKARPDND